MSAAEESIEADVGKMSLDEKKASIESAETTSVSSEKHCLCVKNKHCCNYMFAGCYIPIQPFLIPHFCVPSSQKCCLAKSLPPCCCQKNESKDNGDNKECECCKEGKCECCKTGKECGEDAESAKSDKSEAGSEDDKEEEVVEEVEEEDDENDDKDEEDKDDEEEQKDDDEEQKDDEEEQKDDDEEAEKQKEEEEKKKKRRIIVRRIRKRGGDEVIGGGTSVAELIHQFSEDV